MWEQNKIPSQFITLDDCIKAALTDLGEQGNHLYNRAKTMAIRGWNELGFDVNKKIEQRYLPVNAETKTAKLPDDYVQWLRVGTINQGNEINDLTVDTNLVFHPVLEDCEDAHCECGCSSPLCEAISNAETITEIITIDSVDYVKTTTVCVNESGTITARVCEPVVTNPTQECTYTVDFPLSGSSLEDAPFTNFTIFENGVAVFIGDISNLSELTEVMNANGFSTPVSSENKFAGFAGAALNNLGNLDYRDNVTWNDFINGIFTFGVATAGAESNWEHFESSTGYPVQTPVTPRVGFGSNVDQIEYFTSVGSNIADAEQRNNETGVDFFAAIANYCVDHELPLLYTANIAHGTVAEMIQFLDYFISLGLTVIVRYGCESSIGASNPTIPNTALTSAEYLDIVEDFDDEVLANYPDVVRIIDTAKQNFPSWNNDDVIAWALARPTPITQFRNYLHIEAPTAQSPLFPKNIDDYFDVVIPEARACITDDLMVRVANYNAAFGSDMKLHVAQDGVSAQNTGYATGTQAHTLLQAELVYYLLEYNYDNDDFIKNMVLLENESAVDKKGGEAAFTIDPAFKIGSGQNTFVKRNVGVFYDKLKTVFTYNGLPTYIRVTVDPVQDDLKAWAFIIGDRVLMYYYNFSDTEVTVDSITITDSDNNNYTASSNINIDGITATKIYGSIGASAANNVFGNTYAAFNPDYVPVNVQPDLRTVVPINFTLPQFGYGVIELFEGTDIASMTIELEAGAPFDAPPDEEPEVEEEVSDDVITYTNTDSADVFTSVTFTNNDNESVTLEIEQSSCSNPTSIVETVCHDEVVCRTETLPCGCPVLTNEVVNTIQQWGTLFNEFIQRDLNGLDWQQTFKQPLSWFGYFNVNAEMGIIQLDPNYPFDTVYIQYYSVNEITGGDYLIPVFAKQALAAYIVHQVSFYKRNVSPADKRIYQKAYYNEKSKLHQRNNPARMAEIMDVTRMSPRP